MPADLIRGPPRGRHLCRQHHSRRIGNAKIDMVRLQRTLSFIVFMVTHDVKSLYDRVAALVDGRIAALGPLQSVLASDHGAMIPPKATLEGEVVGLGVAGKTNERAR
ncbi:hypothetical protein J6524_17950 [Bradyrhizobium sp. WSM 1738]|uniref:hypothetical protein n=1 Tax=Bradyrhizobium hereditatis TaxID=2821405 RepID=UPI001CE32ED5|nr:hypothetical protein [Bradyrhizobium hereditatis]MCA6116766.1 hypothetical protein [Bradyrhizobium hereditatis]